jgi:sugar lactone lactonase YvrE
VVGTLAGTAGQFGSTDGAGAVALFKAPEGVAVDASGNVYVADAGNNTVRKITPAGMVSTLAGMAGQFGRTDGAGSAARFDFPTGIAVDGTGDLYLADSGNSTIRKITPAGVVSTLASTWLERNTDGTGSIASFNYPVGPSVDGAGNVYVADKHNNVIRKISPAGIVTTVTGTDGDFEMIEGPVPARLFRPAGVAFSPKTGRLFIAVQDAVLEAVF